MNWSTTAGEVSFGQTRRLVIAGTCWPLRAGACAEARKPTRSTIPSASLHDTVFMMAPRSISDRFTNLDRSLEDFGPGECEQGVHDPACGTGSLPGRAEDDFFVNRIERNSGRHIPRELLDRDLPAGSNIAIIVDTPRANESSLASGDDPAFRRIHLERIDTSHAALRTRDDGLWPCISAGGAIKDQHRIADIGKQHIADGIHGHSCLPSDLRIGPAEDTFGRHVSFRRPIEHQYRIRNDCNVDLVVHRIGAHDIVAAIGRTLYSRMRSLNDPNRRFF